MRARVYAGGSMKNALTVVALGAALTAASVHAADAGKIVWDVTHGTYNAYNISGNYSTLAGQLGTAGFTVTEVSGGIGNANLSDVNVIVVAVTNAWTSSYTANEVAAIKDFVFRGGGLFVMCDEIGIPAN